MHRFSIIIPVYNTAQYLQQCLDSILSQSFTDFEIICIDDHSTDDSLSIVRSYADKDGRVRVLINPRKGVSSARNTGLEAVRGEYVLFVDSDDWILPGSLLIFDKVIQEHYPSILVYPSKRYLESQDRYIENLCYEERSFSSGIEYYENASGHDVRDSFGTICGKVYRTEFLKSRGIRFSEEISYHEDLLFSIDTCFGAGMVQVISDVCYVYRIRQSGSLMTTNPKRRCMDMSRVANLLNERYLNRQDVPYTTLCRTISSYYRNSLVLGGRRAYSALYGLIDWEAFRRASSCSIKARIAFWGLYIVPQLMLPILTYRNNRQVEILSRRDLNHE